MNEYTTYGMAIIIGILIAILLKWKDIAEILKLRKEIKQLRQAS
jgi:uncharacterized integral membrane protein